MRNLEFKSACVCAGGRKSALGLEKCVAEPLSERFDCVQTSSWACKMHCFGFRIKLANSYEKSSNAGK